MSRREQVSDETSRRLANICRFAVAHDAFGLVATIERMESSETNPFWQVFLDCCPGGRSWLWAGHQANLPADWKSCLLDCDFQLAKERLGGCLEVYIREAFITEADCASPLSREEFRRGWSLFAEHPSFSRAAAFIDAVPDYSAHLFWWHFAQCCDGGPALARCQSRGARH